MITAFWPLAGSVEADTAAGFGRLATLEVELGTRRQTVVTLVAELIVPHARGSRRKRCRAGEDVDYASGIDAANQMIGLIADVQLAGNRVIERGDGKVQAR